VRKREKERVDERERLGEDLELGGGDGDGGGGGCLNRREWRLVRGALVSTCDVQEKVTERERGWKRKVLARGSSQPLAGVRL